MLRPGAAARVVCLVCVFVPGPCVACASPRVACPRQTLYLKREKAVDIAVEIRKLVSKELVVWREMWFEAKLQLFTQEEKARQASEKKEVTEYTKLEGEVRPTPSLRNISTYILPRAVPRPVPPILSRHIDSDEYAHRQRRALPWPPL
jgi:hypothetical protein